MKSRTTMALRRLALCAAPLMFMWGLAVAPARAQDATAVAPAQTQTPIEEKLSEGQIDQLVAPHRALSGSASESGSDGLDLSARGRRGSAMVA
jgi:hypothetical protein